MGQGRGGNATTTTLGGNAITLGLNVVEFVLLGRQPFPFLAQPIRYFARIEFGQGFTHRHCRHRSLILPIVLHGHSPHDLILIITLGRQGWFFWLLLLLL